MRPPRTLLLASFLIVSSCSNSEEYNDPEFNEYGDAIEVDEESLALEDDEVDADPYFDEAAIVAGETYEDYDERRDALSGSAGEYQGQGCTVDCSGHEAGYNWAAENGITDEGSCGGQSWSFIEGCRSYALEQ